MDKYTTARNERMGKWQALQSSYEKTSKVLEDEWKKIEKGHKDLQAKKEDLASEHGGSEVSDSDILDINAGGQIIRVSRGTLTQIKGSRLEAIFSGRWEKRVQRDSKGRIFLDVNPTCFRCIVDYLNEYKIAPPDNPPDLPQVDLENQDFLNALLVAFGLDDGTVSLDTEILTNPDHVHSLTQFLAEDDTLGKRLTLLYRGTRDGLDAGSFHQNCDGQGSTVTVVKSTGNYIFGGFSDKPWNSNRGYKPSEKAFLFGLSCHGGTEPVQLKLKNHQQGMAIYFSSFQGPSFGEGHDLQVLGSYSYSRLGSSYHKPPGNHQYSFTGSKNFTVSEMEVFKVTEGPAPSHRIPPQPVQGQAHELRLDVFPEDVHLSFKAEEEALLEASKELVALQEAFSKEQAAAQVFCQGDNHEIVLLNVSGNSMAVNHATLAKYPDSVLYKQFADPNWNGKRKRAPLSPHEWEAKEVVAWSKNIRGLVEDVSVQFEDVTGPELLVLGREDIKDLGIVRPGTVALIVDAIQKLRDEDEANSATFIEHSDYCFGKIIDHMRLKAMSGFGVSDPAPPTIREQDLPRFKRIVEYYFPTQESAADFLA